LRFLDREGCAEWTKDLGSVDPNDVGLEPGTRWTRSAGSIESLAASRQMWLAERIVHWVFEPGSTEALVWARLTGVWDENLTLYRLLRRKHLSEDGVEHSPGHVFARDEREDGTALVFLALVYGWDVLVVTNRGARCVHISHDGVVWARGESAEMRDAFLESVPR
jgi:hypothetical protein